jgi:hypothetical protein
MTILQLLARYRAYTLRSADYKKSPQGIGEQTKNVKIFLNSLPAAQKASTPDRL